MGSDFLTGLISGFSRSLTDASRATAEKDARDQQLELQVLNHLAQSSDDPDVRTLALSGLMELSQGGRKRGGLLGLGKLRTTPSYQKLYELAQRAQSAGLMGGGAQGPPAAPAASPGGSYTGETDEAGTGAPLVGQFVDRQVGTPSGPPGPPGASGIPPMSAALPSTSPTTGGPPPMPVGSPDRFGIRGPIGTAEAAQEIRGRVDPQDVARENARLERERLAQEAVRKRDEKKAEDAAKAAAEREDRRDNRLTTTIDAAAQRQEAAAAAAEARRAAEEKRKETERAARDENIARRRLDDQLARARRDRIKVRANVNLIGKERQAALDEVDQIEQEAYDAYYRETGVDPRKRMQPGPPLEGGPPPAPAPAGASPAPAGAPAAVAPGGPPGPPPAPTQVPNWDKIVSQVEAARRGGMTPQQILKGAQQATPPFSPAQLQALKIYLRL